MLAHGTLITADNRTEWEAERRRVLGASEVAAAVGLCPFTTPVELWQRKMGLAPGFVASEASEWGLALEPVVLGKYAERTGRRIERQQVYLRHEEYPWLIATVDAVADDGRLVEVKTTGAHMAASWGEDGTDEIPDSYTLQVTQQMALHGARLADVAVLIGGQRMRIHPVQYDPDLAGKILAGAIRFWECVQTGTPPDWGRQTAATLAILNPWCEGSCELPLSVQADVQIYLDAKADAKSAEARATNARARVLAAMGNAKESSMQDGRVIRRYLVEVPERTHTVTSHVKHYFTVSGFPRD